MRNWRVYANNSISMIRRLYGFEFANYVLHWIIMQVIKCGQYAWLRWFRRLIVGLLIAIEILRFMNADVHFWRWQYILPNNFSDTYCIVLYFEYGACQWQTLTISHSIVHRHTFKHHRNGYFNFRNDTFDYRNDLITYQSLNKLLSTWMMRYLLPVQSVCIWHGLKWPNRKPQQEDPLNDYSNVLFVVEEYLVSNTKP